MDNKQLILDAANTLAREPGASDLYQQLVEVLALPSHLSVKLAGDAAVLNPLLTLAREDSTKFVRMVDIIELRREARGLPSLRLNPDDEKFDKNRYQRKLMAEIRLRTVKAVGIENLRRPPSGQLVGQPRMEFQKLQQSKWSSRLKHRVVAQLGSGPVSKPDRAKVAEQFWAEVDQELAEAEAAVMRWIQTGRKGIAPDSSPPPKKETPDSLH